MAIFEAPQFPDPSQMRRAGKPTVTSKPGGVGTMARLADQEARHKSVLRPTGGASYDPKTREMRRLAVVVEQLAKEQAASASAETAAADVFSAVSNRVSVLEKAFTDLVDAVTQELGDARGERKRWQQDAEALGVRIDRCEVTTAECAATCAALSTTFDDRAVARREALTAASAVTEARQALQAAERTHLEVNERLEALENVARDADAALQAQIDELGESAARAEFRRAGAGGGQVSTPGGTHVVTTRDILLAGAASEADVVALRDWTKQVTESHAARLTKVETFVLDGKKSRSSKKPSTNAEPTPTSRPRKEEESEGSA